MRGTRQRLLRSVLTVVVGWTLLAAAQPVCAADSEKVAKIKAAYLVNFIQYVTWPAQAFESDKSALVVAVLGEDPMGAVLDHTLRTAEGFKRPLHLLRYAMPERAQFKTDAEHAAAVAGLTRKLLDSHVLFVCDSARGHAAQVIGKLHKHPVLIIGDGKAFAEMGAMLSLGMEDGRIVFYTNRQAIGESPLKISSKLLRLGREA